MKAIVVNGTDATVIDSRAPPHIRDDYLLVRTVAVGLNPGDWKAISGSRVTKESVAGYDFAGIVEAVGSAVKKPWKKGDRICGVAYGVNSLNAEDGAFAETIVAKADTCIKIPDSMSLEDASTIGVSALTCGQGLFQKMKLNLPDNPIKEKEYLLVYGGSTSSGSLGIQYAKLAGYTVITTCSPANFDMVKSRGAEAAFDYRDQDCGQKIHDYTNGSLRYIWDTIGSEDGMQICTTALSTTLPGLRYGSILLTKLPRDDVEFSSSILMTFTGEAISLFGTDFPPNEENFTFAQTFASLTEKLLADGLLKPHPSSVRPNGLHGVLDGLSMLKAGTVSGQKLVYRIADTV